MFIEPVAMRGRPPAGRRAIHQLRWWDSKEMAGVQASSYELYRRVYSQASGRTTNFHLKAELPTQESIRKLPAALQTST